MTLADSILATLAYHDIFEYPLTKDEIHRFLIGPKTPIQTLQKTLNRLVANRKIGESEECYFLQGQEKLVAIRKKRLHISQKKLKKAHFFAQILKIIPTVKLIGISGALAMTNSHQKDDIDLVIISKKNTLWTTRFLANLLLLPFKRDIQGKNISDRACLNLFLDDKALKISPQNIYIAHEICQMKPLWDRDNTYQKFLNANWLVKKFLPNWTPNQVESQSGKLKVGDPKRIKFSIFASLEAFLTLVALSAVEGAEWVAKWGQLRYMEKRRTSEKISNHQLFFHPQNTQDRVLDSYQKRLKNLKFFNT